ncbi:MAG: phosphatidylserine decarboxylase family protein [Candidatus Zixiibacteriota bacterium]
MIAREGLYLILTAVVITIGFILAASRWDSKVLFAISALFALLTMFTVFFFRDPVRKPVEQERVLVAPADGKVIGVDTLQNHEFIGGPAIKVSIFLSVFDVHVNRVPATGVVDFVKYNPGKFFVAYADKASDLNEQTEIGMTAEGGHKLIFKQIAGLIARRVVCRLEQGSRVTAGERFGMIKFGSRAELVVSAGSQIEVKVGDHVAGGTSVIGYLPEKTAKSGEESSARGSNVQI